MRYLVRAFFLLLVAGGIAAGLVWAFWPRPVPVELTTVTRGPLRVTVDEDGKTRIKDRYVVAAPLAGNLLRITLDPGDEVVAGKTLLAVIEPPAPKILDAREVAQAEARVQTAEAALAHAEPAIEKARVERDYAESELARLRRLAKSQTISVDRLEEMEAGYRAREQDLRAATLARDVARFELELAKAALVRVKPEDDGAPDQRQFKIMTPISGQVLRVFQESATVVQTGMPLVELGDPSSLEIEVDVLSADAVKIRPGTRAILEQWGGPRDLHAKVRRIEPAAFTKLSALGVEEQRVWVILDLVEPPEQRRELGDAFRVEARIVIWEQDQVLQVPTGALFHQRQQWGVFGIVDGRAVLKTVEIGQRNSLAAEVVSGLAEGEAVILHPSDKVSPGIAVQPRDLSGG